MDIRKERTNQEIRDDMCRCYKTIGKCGRRIAKGTIILKQGMLKIIALKDKIDDLVNRM